MKITEKDVGRKVFRRSGEIVTLRCFDDIGAITEDSTNSVTAYTKDGRYYKDGGVCNLDLVGFVDELETQECEITTATVEHDEEDDIYITSAWSWPVEEQIEELDERFVTKVPSIESNAIRLLKQLKAQGIMQLTIVADLGDGKEGEIKVEVYGKN